MGGSEIPLEVTNHFEHQITLLTRPLQTTFSDVLHLTPSRESSKSGDTTGLCRHEGRRPYLENGRPGHQVSWGPNGLLWNAGQNWPQEHANQNPVFAPFLPRKLRHFSCCFITLPRSCPVLARSYSPLFYLYSKY